MRRLQARHRVQGRMATKIDRVTGKNPISIMVTIASTRIQIGAVALKAQSGAADEVFWSFDMELPPGGDKYHSTMEAGVNFLTRLLRMLLWACFRAASAIRG